MNDNGRLHLPRPRIYRSLLIIAQLTVLFLIGWFIFRAFSQHWYSVQESITTLNMPLFGFAIAILVLAWLLLPFISFVLLRSFHVNWRFGQAIVAFCGTQAAKYLPGGLWALPGRAVYYQQQHGLALSRSSVAVLLETGILATGSLAVSIAFLLILLKPPLLVVVGLLLAALIIATLIARQLQKLAQTDTHNITRWVQLGTLSIIFWLLVGVGFHIVTMSVTSTEVSWVMSVANFSFAWLIGFLVVIVPAGLGIREATLTFLLSSAMPTGEAVLIALLARLWWTIAEVVWITISFVIFVGSMSPKGDEAV